MPGQHSPQMHQIAVKFHHQVWRQIENEATRREMKTGEYIRHVVTEAVSNSPLSAADAQLIADRIAEAEKSGRMV